MQKRTSPYCRNTNYFCGCFKCKQALEKVRQIELTAIDQERKIQRDCESSRGKLSDELMREVV